MIVSRIRRWLFLRRLDRWLRDSHAWCCLAADQMGSSRPLEFPRDAAQQDPAFAIQAQSALIRASLAALDGGDPAAVFEEHAPIL